MMMIAMPDDDDTWITEELDLVFGLMLGVDFQDGSVEKAIETGIGKSSSQACDESIEFIQLMIETVREIPFGPPEPDCWTGDAGCSLDAGGGRRLLGSRPGVLMNKRFACCQLVA